MTDDNFDELRFNEIDPLAELEGRYEDLDERLQTIEERFRMGGPLAATLISMPQLRNYPFTRAIPLREKRSGINSSAQATM